MGTRPPSAPVTVVPISGASVEFKVQSEDQEVRDENSSFGCLLIGEDQQRSGGRDGTKFGFESKLCPKKLKEHLKHRLLVKSHISVEIEAFVS